MFYSCWINAKPRKPAIWTFLVPVMLIVCVSMDLIYITYECNIQLIVEVSILKVYFKQIALTILLYDMLIRVKYFRCRVLKTARFLL